MYLPPTPPPELPLPGVRPMGTMIQPDTKSMAERHALSYIAAMSTMRQVAGHSNMALMEQRVPEVISTMVQRCSLHFLSNCVTLVQGLVDTRFAKPHLFQEELANRFRALHQAGVGLNFTGNVFRVEARGDARAICWITWRLWPRNVELHGPCLQWTNIYGFRRLFVAGDRITGGWEIVKRDEEVDVLAARVPNLYPHPQQMQMPQVQIQQIQAQYFYPPQTLAIPDQFHQQMGLLRPMQQAVAAPNQPVYTHLPPIPMDPYMSEQQPMLYAPPMQIPQVSNLYLHQPALYESLYQAVAPPNLQDVPGPSIENAPPAARVDTMRRRRKRRTASSFEPKPVYQGRRSLEPYSSPRAEHTRDVGGGIKKETPNNRGDVSAPINTATTRSHTRITPEALSDPTSNATSKTEPSNNPDVVAPPGENARCKNDPSTNSPRESTLKVENEEEPQEGIKYAPNEMAMNEFGMEFERAGWMDIWNEMVQDLGSDLF